MWQQQSLIKTKPNRKKAGYDERSVAGWCRTAPSDWFLTGGRKALHAPPLLHNQRLSDCCCSDKKVRALNHKAEWEAESKTYLQHYGQENSGNQTKRKNKDQSLASLCTLISDFPVNKEMLRSHVWNSDCFLCLGLCGERANWLTWRRQKLTRLTGQTVRKFQVRSAFR